MGLSGGGDRTLLRSGKPDGSIPHELGGERVLGNHKGQYASLNIVGGRPGIVHQYALRNPSSVNGARTRGWWVADPERDGRPAYMLALGKSDTYTPPDSVANSHFPDLVHMCTTEENLRRLTEEREAQNRENAQVHGADFLNGASAAEMQTGRTARGIQTTRFALGDHGLTVREGDTVLTHITPNGVLREE